MEYLRIQKTNVIEESCSYKVQFDDHYCPDNADNAHQGIRKRHETGHYEYRDMVFQFPIFNGSIVFHLVR